MLISRSARQLYQFEDGAFDSSGRYVFSDYPSARRFAARMGAVRAAPVPASEIHAMGLIDEILRILVRQYAMQNPGVMTRAVVHLQTGLGHRLEELLQKFTGAFPPSAVYRSEISIQDHLAGVTRGILNRELAIEEILLIDTANGNPAQQPYKDLFDDAGLRSASAYQEALALLADFFARQLRFGPGVAGAGGETLDEVLHAPAKASPYSLAGQLEFLLTKWRAILGERFALRVLRGLDFLKEEAMRGPGPAGFGGEAPVLTFGDDEAYERFSPDRDWMPALVLIARNAYVWLDQLSRRYGRAITHLDHIPDEELDLLARRGFSGLWLIGVWERSRASQRIKQLTGNPDAVASAYSVYTYDVAGDLGGWDAYGDLRARAWQRGIRLAADMVPNHMGIDSQWVIEHPDWFLSRAGSPYPGYSFNGPDLSADERVGIYLEDHYYDKTDAAVVFKRLDRWTGEARYVYHGNDGTSYPWNDTAQIDYLNPEAREAVIQTILHVARNFPVIRFDAAMTLARKHIQRLWYPEPGQGGAIPSRAEYGMTRVEFETKLSKEFWREVVDRLAVEAPDTLLLAEAFWMMEGYFVRTLGMHRVYNSAFMHMLRDETNAEYRKLVKNVLEFDPQVLKRFVNFMNNPDEKTAVEQFGSGDKYFGVCTLMVTLPGLPMFGHGQVEGFREKYGMEFRRARLDEAPDEGMVRGHEWRIFPLLHRRALFAEVEDFLLYDFFTEAGRVNEDVIAYSNRCGEDRCLIVYHNRFADTRGWVRTSAAFKDKGSGRLVQRTLAEGLGLAAGGEDYLVFRDYTVGLEYIRPVREIAEKGLYVSLGAYQCHVFMDFRIVSGAGWRAVYDALGGAGVPYVEDKLNEILPSVVESPPVAEPAAGGKKTARKPAGARKAKPPAAKAKRPAPVKKAAAKKAAAKTKRGTRPASTKTAAKKKSVPPKNKAPKKAVKPAAPRKKGSGKNPEKRGR